MIKECYTCGNFNPFIEGVCDRDNKYESDGWTDTCGDEKKRWISVNRRKPKVAPLMLRPCKCNPPGSGEEFCNGNCYE